MVFPSTLDDLKSIVAERLEETMHLEFKRQLPESGNNYDLARDIAAMANTEGGVIVYGVEEKSGRAEVLAPLDIKGVAARVTLIARSSLDEKLALSNVYTIPDEGDAGKGYLVVEVPRSERAPHLHNGTAYGRTAKGVYTMTRRQVGELFARSPGFAEEFGLLMSRAGRFIARVVREPYTESTSGGQLKTRYNHALMLDNDGESEVFDADWEWIKANPDDAEPLTYQNPFPVDVLPPGAKVRIGLDVMVNTASNLRIRTSWRDANGEDSAHVWPITW